MTISTNPPRDSADGRRLAPATIAQARRLFEIAGLDNTEIGRQVGINRGTVAKLACDGDWLRPPSGTGAGVGGLRARIDREIAKANEAAQDALAAGEPAAERAARTLGSLVKTLRELADFDERQARLIESAASEDAHGDGAGFADLDAFRDELAARIDQLRGDRDGPAGG